jgi:NAD(P)H-hydrate epimerase
MRQIDEAAIEVIGIPRLLLMEHAGLAVAHAVRHLNPPMARSIVVCCGTGFNGGDGLSAARHLHAWGYALHLLIAGPLSRLSGEPSTYGRMLQRLGLPLTECAGEVVPPQTDSWWSECGLIIDALLGIGVHGPVREPIASLIVRMNRSGKPILAVDIPSGLDADTGRVQGGLAVSASVTVTFGLAKQGCFLEEGPAHTGTLTIDPITIPRHLLEGGRA